MGNHCACDRDNTKIEEAKGIFHTIDRNGDGELSKEEALHFFRKHTATADLLTDGQASREGKEEAAEDWFDEHCTPDGVIFLADFTDAYVQAMAGREHRMQESFDSGLSAMGARVFEAIDTNHDGKLTHQELSAFLDNHKGIRKLFGPEDTTWQPFVAYFKEGEGEMDRAEFAELWSQKNPGSPQIVEREANGMFCALDRKGNQKLDKEEVFLGLQSCKAFKDLLGDAKSADDFMKGYDVNLDGFVYEYTFSYYFLLKKGERIARQEESMECGLTAMGARIFDIMDKDHDGELSCGEIKTFMREHRGIEKQLGYKNSQKFFKRWDADGDGRVRRKEFAAAWQRDAPPHLQ